jgi:RNA polymerase sigma factor (sigma-70 family)
MPTSPTSQVIHHLRHVLLQDECRLTDAQLLGRFIERRDEAAFTALVERYGALVWSVCRRLLGQHDAEDAFQATFLVLCRKAVSIRRREMLASWLHGVAHQTALQAQRSTARKRAREKQVMNLPEPAIAEPDLWHELRPLLDRELSYLPEKYRVVILLCDLEGKSRKETARQLGLPEGTIASRLGRARALLAKRLARHGVAVPAGTLAALVSQNGASAGVPISVVSCTVATVFSSLAGPAALPGAISCWVAPLAEGTLNAMLSRKLGIAVIVVAFLSAVAAGACGLLLPAEKVPEVTGIARAAPGASEQAKALVELPVGAVARLGTVRFRHPGIVSAVALSGNGVLATAGSAGIVCLWDASSGKPVRRLRPAWTLAGPFRRSPLWTHSVAFSPDGRTVLASCDNGIVYLWNTNTGAALRCLTGHSGVIRSAAFSPDSTMVASTGDDRTVRLWQVATGKELRRFEGKRKHDGWTLAFAPDGKTLATGGNTGEVFLYDVATGRELRGFRGHRSVANSVHFCRDGKTFLSGSHDGTIRMWDTSTGRELRRFQAAGEIWVITLSADGRSLAALTREHFVQVWDLTSLRETKRFEVEWSMQGSLLFAPDGKTLIAGDGCSISRWDTATGKQVLPALGHRAVVMSLSFAPDGKTLGSGGLDGKVCTWDVARATPIGCVARHREDVRAVTFAPGGRLLASASADGVIMLSDPATGRLLRTLSGCKSTRLALSFTPDGKRVASQGRDELLHSWDVASGRDRGSWQGQQDFVTGLGYSPDGTLLASAGRVPRRGGKRANYMTITLWSADSRRELRHFPEHEGLETVVFSPRGSVLVSGGWDGTVRVWETPTGGERCRFSVPRQETPAIAISPDGALLALGCRDGTLRLLDLDTGIPCGQVRGPLGGIFALAFSPDGRLLASGGDDTTILLWDVARICKRQAQPTVELSGAEIEESWTDLANPKFGHGYRALLRLAAARGQAVVFVKQRIRPVAAPDRRRLARWIRDLDDERFAVREQASRELAALGEVAVPALREAINRKPLPEAARRIRRLLDQQEERTLSTEELRVVRSVELLEMIATPDSRRVLAALAEGAEGARLSREARAALDRLNRRALR